MAGLTPSQLTWMQSDYTAAKAASKTHTFIFTHGPIVGHGGGATHDSWDIMIGPDGELIPVRVDHDAPFVEWVNEPGMTVEAVFCGHTHQDHVFYGVHTDLTQPGHINEPFDLLDYIRIQDTAYIYYDSRAPIPSSGVCGSPAFIETNTACKGY